MKTNEKLLLIVKTTINKLHPRLNKFLPEITEKLITNEYISKSLRKNSKDNYADVVVYQIDSICEYICDINNLGFDSYYDESLYQELKHLSF
jgi:hypothetical protein